MQNYAQQDMIKIEDTFSHVTRLESIRMFLSFSIFRNFKVYQMDVKYEFLIGNLEEEVYIEQPKGFILGNYEKFVFKLKKALYGIKQAP